MLKNFLLLSLTTFITTTPALAKSVDLEYFLVNTLDKPLTLNFQVCEGYVRPCKERTETIQPGKFFREVLPSKNLERHWEIKGVTGISANRRSAFGITCNTFLSEDNVRGILTFEPFRDDKVMCFRG